MRNLSIAHPIIACSIFVGALLYSNLTLASDWLTMTPKGGESHAITIKDHEWEYYRLKPGQSMDYEFDRLGKCEIITRPEMPSNKREVLYSFRLGWEEKSSGILLGRGSPKSKWTVKGTGVPVGRSRSFDRAITSDRKRLHLAVDKKAPCAVYFRVRFQSEFIPPKGSYIAFQPTEFEKQVNVVTNESLSEYHLLDEDENLRFDIIGPTALKVYVRLGLSETLYPKRAITVLQDGKTIDRHSLRFSSSSVSKLMDDPKVVLSRAESFFVEVPPGKHRYQFRDSRKSGMVLVRVFLPESGLNPNG